MINGQSRDGEQKGSAQEKSQVTAPAISLPKGGGAIRGIGEKFAANPVTGSSLACPQYHHLHRDQAHSRRISAITAPQTPRWRPPAPGDCAGQALTGTRRAALLGTCARARATRRHAPSEA